MKYIKCFMPLVLLLVLLVTCLIFPVSAAEPATAASVRNIQFEVNEELVFTLDAGDSLYWSDFAEKRQDGDDFYIFVDGANNVLLYARGYGVFYVYNFNFELQQSNFIIEEEYYLVRVHSFFSIEEFIVGSGASGVVYEMGQIVVSTLSNLAENGVYFNHDTLGLCRFEYFSEKYKNIVVFRVGIKDNGSYSKQYYLISKDDMTVVQGNDVVGSSAYYVADPCSTGIHAFSNWVTDVEPTCLEKGLASRFCMICYKQEHKNISPLGHTYADFDFTCNRCGHFDLLRDPYSGSTNGSSGGGADNSGGDSGPTDGGAGGGDGNDSGADSEGGLLDGVGNALTNAGNAIGNWWNGLWDNSDKEDFSWFPDLGDKLSSAAQTVLLIVGGCILIGLIPVLTPFFKWVGKGITFTWNSLKDLFKSIGNSASKSSRSRKGKNKKRSKK